MFRRPKSWRQMLSVMGLATLLAIDAGQLLPAMPTNGTVSEASLLPWRIAGGRKIFDPDGNFLGCLVGGNECAILYVAPDKAFNVSTEGIHSQD